LTLPRQPRHYLLRAGYLGLLIVLGSTIWQTTVGWGRSSTLGDNARFGQFLFGFFAYYFELPLLMFFAALSAAGAIAQEKDRRTFALLLLTDLRSHEIVLGKLLGSLLPILVFLVISVPVFALLMLLGGVAAWQIAQATLILAAAALAAGSLGGLVALGRERTFQTLALTVLFLVLYLSAVQMLPLLGARLGGQALQVWFDPFQALRQVLTELRGAPATLRFVSGMLLLSALLNGWGILRLRVWNPSGDPVVQREALASGGREPPEDLGGVSPPLASLARPVWANPILWREMRTRAYGRRPLLVKSAYLVLSGLLTAYALMPLWFAQLPPVVIAPAADGLVPLSILSLLLVSAQAVTAITSERDTGALDLLLVTDLTPREFICGKLGGIAWNTWLYVLPPLVLTWVYAAHGLLATPPRDHEELRTWKNMEAAVCITITLLVLFAFVAVLGLHIALRTESSRVAILHALGTVFFLSGGTLICVGLILLNRDRFESQWTSFILFLAAGIGGLWWVLSGERPTAALTLASAVCPLVVFYTLVSIVIGKPGSQESSDPLIPTLLLVGAFGFTIRAMLVPLLSEFDAALGRTGRA
jgi:ABC-type transport system involved in multi-copper enzyme maturation permease subunit